MPARAAVSTFVGTVICTSISTRSSPLNVHRGRSLLICVQHAKKSKIAGCRKAINEAPDDQKKVKEVFLRGSLFQQYIGL
jgi:hypothetical protein